MKHITMLAAMALAAMTATAQGWQPMSGSDQQNDNQRHNRRHQQHNPYTPTTQGQTPAGGLFTVDAQLRMRGEYNNGAGTPRAEGVLPATFVNERARLSVGYLRDDLELKVAGQHTGIWGQNDINANDGSAAINEAWAKLLLGDGFFVQAGRQQLSYDDERILGGLDWNVSGNWHDALRLGYEGDEHRLHVVYAFNQAKANVHGAYYDGPMPYKSLATLWYHYQAPATPFGISLMALEVGREGGTEARGKTRHMQTLGTDINYKPADLGLHGAFYYQTGRNAADTKVAAWMASAQLTYTLVDDCDLTLGYDYRSGNDGKGNKQKAFDQLYGTHHKFYGAMDYFTQTVPTGLQDIQAGLTTRMSPYTSLALNYHYFLTAEKVGDSDKGLGHEVDLQFSGKIARDVTLQAGYSFMLGTKTMDAVMGGSHKSWQDWAWVSLNINPRIFATR